MNNTIIKLLQSLIIFLVGDLIHVIYLSTVTDSIILSNVVSIIGELSESAAFFTLTLLVGALIALLTRKWFVGGIIGFCFSYLTTLGPEQGIIPAIIIGGTIMFILYLWRKNKKNSEDSI